MRKEDRIRMSHQQDRSTRGPDDKTSMDPRGREQGGLIGVLFRDEVRHGLFEVEVLKI